LYSDNGPPVPIPDSLGGTYPQVSGDNITWENGGDIFLYNDITKLTVKISNDTSTFNQKPQISGDNVVWMGNTGSDSEIFLYNIPSGALAQLSNNDSLDWTPQISGSNVVWHGIGNDGASDNEIFNAFAVKGMRYTPDAEIPDTIKAGNAWGHLELQTGQFKSDQDTIVIIHGWDAIDTGVIPGWMFDMKNAFLNRTDTADKNIFFWNWATVAGTGTIFDPTNEYIAGESIALSRELQELFKQGDEKYIKNIHLIGFSLGAGIAARVASYLDNQYNIDRLTLLDGPVYHPLGPDKAADVYLEKILSSLNDSIFVENVNSQFGAMYLNGDVDSHDLRQSRRLEFMNRSKRIGLGAT